MTSPYTQYLKQLGPSYLYRILPNGKVLIVRNSLVNLTPRYRGRDIEQLNSTISFRGSNIDPDIIGGFISKTRSNEFLYYFEDRDSVVLINPNPTVLVITGTLLQNLFV